MEINYEKEKRMGLTPKLNLIMESMPDDCVLSPEEIADYMGMSVRQV